MPPSYRAGQQFYDAAVDALDRQGQAGDLTLKLDTYLERWVTGIETGQIEDLKALAQKAEALAESMGDRARLAQWRVRQAQARWNIWADPEPLERAVELALDAFGLADAHDVRTQSYALFLAGASCTDLGRLREAISHQTQARHTTRR